MSEETYKELEERIIKLKELKDWDSINEIMSSIYKKYKPILNNFSKDFNTLLSIFKLESLLENEFLDGIDSRPIFYDQEEYNLENIHNETNPENVVIAIVKETRKRLGNYNDVANDTLKANCITSSSYVEEICEKYQIECMKFGVSEDLTPGNFHNFNIVTIRCKNGEEKSYLVDCTYRQFFTKADSNLDRIGLIGNSGCGVGTYMMMTESRRKTAEELLTKGYVEATEENLKNYFDGIVLSGRNGNFYQAHPEQIGVYTTPYTKDDYIYMIISKKGTEEDKNQTGRMIKKVEVLSTIKTN